MSTVNIVDMQVRRFTYIYRLPVLEPKVRFTYSYRLLNLPVECYVLSCTRQPPAVCIRRALYKEIQWINIELAKSRERPKLL